MDSGVQQRYERAVDRLVADCSQDPWVLAVVLAGSMANDRVWEKSDLDVCLITQETKLVDTPGILLYEDVPVHVQVMPRSKFKALFEGAVRSSFMHSYLAKGRLVFTRDPVLQELWEGRERFGERDRAVRLLGLAAELTMALSKAEKWLVAKGDPHYASVWLQFCATQVASMVVTLQGEITGREVLQQARRYEPDLVHQLYEGFLDAPKTNEIVQDAIDTIHSFLRTRQREVFGLVLDYLAEQPGAVSARELDHYFRHHHGVECAAFCCEYLSDEGVVRRMPLAARLTERSKADVQEAGFYLEAR